MTPDRCGQGSFHSGQGPDPNCRSVAVVGSRVKLVGSGLGAGPIFLCPDQQCRAGGTAPADQVG